MGNLTLNGATSGQITLAPTAVAGTNTLTLPAATGTVLTTAGGQTISGTVTLSTLTSPAATALTIQSAGTTAMTIDTSQNVGIGTTSPQAKIHAAVTSGSGAATEVARFSGSANGAGSGALIRFTNTGSGTNPGPSQYNTGGIAAVDDTNNFGGALLFYTPNSGVSGGGNLNERMRIDSSGNLLVGTTSSDPSGANVTGVAIGGTGYISTCNSSNVGAIFARKTTTGDIVVFRYGTTQVGTINTNGTGVTYNSASDYRLKHDVAPLSNGLSTVSALKPVTYKWKSDDSYGEGFIAHELQEIVPLAVTGEKDAVNEDGSIKPQGVDYSKIVVHLVAAIKELKAELDALKGTK